MICKCRKGCSKNIGVKEETCHVHQDVIKAMHAQTKRKMWEILYMSFHHMVVL